MTTNKIHLAKRRQLFEVCYCYTDGEYTYRERLFYRCTRNRLEDEIRFDLHGFANDEVKITWSFDHQDATPDSRSVQGFSRYLEISAREIDSLEDLNIWELSEKDSGRPVETEGLLCPRCDEHQPILVKTPTGQECPKCGKRLAA